MNRIANENTILTLEVDAGHTAPASAKVHTAPASAKVHTAPASAKVHTAPTSAKVHLD